MKGRQRKTKKREPKKTCAESSSADSVSAPASEGLNCTENDQLTISPFSSSSSPSSPRRKTRVTRKKRETRLTSTPVRSLSTISFTTPSEDEAKLQFTESINNTKTENNSKLQGTKICASQPRQMGKKESREQMPVDGCPAKRRRGRPRKTTGIKRDANIKTSTHSRPRFELIETFATEEEDSLLSSDLSIELSHYEDPTLRPKEQETSEDEEEDKEEDLPSFLMQMDKKPQTITEGTFVWCKYRSYPYWPALVKSVNRKQKKASILFIEDMVIQSKRGIGVALKSLKPFDCEESEELTHKAKETYSAAITWTLELIEDYRIRIACGSFSGSFVEYFNHDMSYPVRRKSPKDVANRLDIATDILTEEHWDGFKDESFNDEHEDKQICKSSRRLLPDRTHAAHNRANQKLVQFIVKQRMVERHLLAVIHGKQQSRWLRAFMSAKRRRVVNVYLEDDEQLDQVYWYLSQLYATAAGSNPSLVDAKSLEHVPFVLDVLLPEAIIYAIAGVDNVSVKKAEEKYLRGRCISNRERQEFDLMIDQEIKKNPNRMQPWTARPLTL